MNTSRNITDLPMEVLGLIFEELPSLSDELSLTQVHPDFGLAFSWLYPKRFKKLNLTEGNNLPVLLPLCGPSVEHINVDDRFQTTMLKLVELHCPNVQSVKIDLSEDHQINTIKSFLANIRSLRSMTLVATNLGIVELLKSRASLKRLCLDYLWRIECTNILDEVPNLVGLEELIIDRSLDDYLDIHELCHRLKALRTLDIKAVVFTAPDEFDGVPCPALRELHLFACGNARFPSDPSILKWILSHAEGLEILTLNIHLMGYKPEIVIYQILSECKNLRSLCMPMPIKVDTDFAHRVVKIVSENGVTSEELPLNLNFKNLSIHEDIQKVMANTSAKQLITIEKCTKCVNCVKKYI